MKSTVEITTLFDCTVERAFKTPMLCDLTKIHTGHGVTPRVTHCTEDEHWGMEGSTRKVHMARTLFFKGGEASMDRVLERRENACWKIEVYDFRTWSMGFNKFQGEWYTQPAANGQVKVRYRYILFSNSVVFYPFHWLFTKVIWRNYMKNVVANIRGLIAKQEPYVHA
jgi:hypothetical protein